jgi:tetratricopeptide (TPR) repeat protein
MESGNHRAAKKKFLLSLRRPTDNALAQAVWASKRTALGNINIDVLEAAQASEALAWNDFNQGKWDNVIFHADKWGREEGFSARPLVLSSSIAASLLRRPDLGEEIARTGLVTNPGHPALVNNVAYSLALQGRATDALSFLENANIANLTTADQVCLLATYGMACYRSGSEEEGTRYYEGAIERAKNANEESLRVSATLHMAYERARLGLRDGVIQFKKAYEAAEKLKSTHLPALADILAEDVEQVAGHLGIAVEIRKPKKVLSLAPDQLWLPPKL